MSVEPLQQSLAEQLHLRRHRLVALPPAQSRHVGDLLRQVDAALAAIDDGSYGLCDVCHDPIEADRLACDPLLRVCIDHLSRGERRALEHDLATAGRLQAALLPEPALAVAGWEVELAHRPAGPVSGDLITLVPSPAGGLHFLLADAMGKGISGALLMAQLVALYRVLVGREDRLETVLGEANRLLCANTPASHYATAVAGHLAADGGLRLAVAGHPPPLLVRAGAVRRLEGGGLPLGLFPSNHFPLHELRLAAGDTLVVYSDGASESADGDGEEYGIERLAGSLAASAGASARQVADGLLADLARFRGGAAAGDDLSLLVVRRRAEAAPAANRDEKSGL
jgi:sigma-B regulation protein RsbU (phosphoserine phosphatase)